MSLEAHQTPDRAAIQALAPLADHLEAVLRHGEALRAIECPAQATAFDGATVPAIIRSSRNLGATANDAYALELAIVLRLRQAKVASGRARQAAPDVATVLRLVEAAAGLVADHDAKPETGPAIDFFVSRGIAGAAGQDGPLALGEGYLLGALTPLGAVMDAAAAALDLIDACARSHERAATMTLSAA